MQNYDVFSLSSLGGSKQKALITEPQLQKEPFHYDCCPGRRIDLGPDSGYWARRTLCQRMPYPFLAPKGFNLIALSFWSLEIFEYRLIRKLWAKREFIFVNHMAQWVTCQWCLQSSWPLVPVVPGGDTLSEAFWSDGWNVFRNLFYPWIPFLCGSVSLKSEITVNWI